MIGYRNWTWTATLGMVALGVAGCTGAGDDPVDAAGGDEPVAADAAAATSSDDDLAAGLIERCVAANEAIGAAEEEFAGDSPEQMVGYFDAFATALEGFAADVGGLEASGDDADALTSLVDGVSGSAASFREAIAAAEAGEDPEPIIGEGFATLTEAEVAAGELGMGSLQDCGAAAEEPDPDATQVAVSATDYAFDVGEVAAGPTAFVMTNDGEEPHFLEVVGLSEPGVLDEALGAEDPEATGLVTEMLGSSSTVGPGGTAVFNTDLEPGTYALVCFVSSPDGTPHAFQGMAEEFTVE